MRIDKAQNDMKTAYLDGGPGVLVSGVVWLTAGIIALYFSKQISFNVFFIGGMLIHPVGVLVTKLFNRSGKHQSDNPLAKLAFENTVILLLGIFIAYTIFQVQPNWLYPIMLIIIGGRYLTFQTVYGMKIYWMLGAILAIAGISTLISNQPFYLTPIIGGLLEIVIGVGIIWNANRH